MSLLLKQLLIPLFLLTNHQGGTQKSSMYATKFPSLMDLGEKNARREAMLKFLLTPAQLGNLVFNATGTVHTILMDVYTQQPMVDVPYILTLDADPTKRYEGITGKDGSIFVPNIPLGEYTMSFANNKYSFVE